MPYPALRRAARRCGYHLVKADYYSPIPDLDALPSTTWTEPSPTPGVDLRIDAALTMLAGPLRAYVEEFAPPAEAPGSARGYHYANPMYGSLDGEVLYAMVRHHRPARVLEIGAGFSTLCIVEALERNEAQGSPSHHVVVDPNPAAVLDRVRDRIELRAVAAESLDAAAVSELRADDLFFIDTTHTLRPANDVLRLLLELLPTVADGVIVHIHDFFRPFEYPRALPEQFGVYWQEHYLVQALLAHSTRWRVLCANHALARLHPDTVAALVPSFSPQSAPSALWIEAVGEASASA